MIQLSVVNKKNTDCFMDFVWEEDPHIRSYKLGLEKLFTGSYLSLFPIPLAGQTILLTGCGRAEEIGLLQVKEIMAFAAAKCKELGIRECSLNLDRFVEKLGEKAVISAVLGLGLGSYEYTFQKSEKQKDKSCHFQLEETNQTRISRELLAEGEELLKGTVFARNMVNTPGNHLRPMDFERAIVKYMEDVEIETRTLVYGQLRALKMEALYGVGGSSEYPPCLVILRYRGNPKGTETYGLIGKGITCDTGGYCLKGSSAMGGIKGDMAGAAAAAAAIHAAAALGLKVNVTACLPLGENRISQSSLLPGDVITGYSGKTIEVLNTDAEGRLILSDAVSYAIKEEGVTSVVDIATLTGAVAQMLGNTIAGAVSDDDVLYGIFEKALESSGERYLRIPFGKEHEKMIQSEVADVKNIGPGHCGTITAALFIREFCERKPWIHLDIAGTAWCGTPTYAFEKAGATGAGVTSLYYFLREAQSLSMQ